MSRRTKHGANITYVCPGCHAKRLLSDGPCPCSPAPERRQASAPAPQQTAKLADYDPDCPFCNGSQRVPTPTETSLMLLNAKAREGAI